MTVLLLLAVLVLVLLNAFFVAAEFALVRSRKAHLQRDADEGRRGAAVAVGMMVDLLREVGDAVHERHRADEVVELVVAHQRLALLAPYSV